MFDEEEEPHGVPPGVRIVQFLFVLAVAAVTALIMIV
jgi:hypothetical protein